MTPMSFWINVESTMVGALASNVSYMLVFDWYISLLRRFQIDLSPISQYRPTQADRFDAIDI